MVTATAGPVMHCGLSGGFLSRGFSRLNPVHHLVERGTQVGVLLFGLFRDGVRVIVTVAGYTSFAINARGIIRVNSTNIANTLRESRLLKGTPSLTFLSDVACASDSRRLNHCSSPATSHLGLFYLASQSWSQKSVNSTLSFDGSCAGRVSARRAGPVRAGCGGVIARTRRTPACSEACPSSVTGT